MQKPQTVAGIGISATIFLLNIVAEIHSNIKQLSSSFNSSNKLLNQGIIDLVKSFVRENKPDQAIEVLEVVGFGEVAEFFVSVIKLGVIV